jgi:uncharacterized protein YdeI (YjbR/CyaY-like superfamily)
MESATPLCFADSRGWRAWLEKNHSAQSEIWLLHSKKGGHRDCLELQEGVDEALCFGWIDSRLVTIDKEHFALRYTPRRPDSVWSRRNRERAEKLIESGRMTEAGLAIIEAAKRRGTWQAAYTDRERVAVPPELTNALSLNVDAMANFAGFPISSQNMYVRWVMAAKTDRTLARRIAEVVRRSSANERTGGSSTAYDGK